VKLTRLIELLEELRADLHDSLGDCDPEVVCAYQPTYPLAGTLDGACFLDDDEGKPTLVNGKPVVWIAVGGPPYDVSPYAPRAVFEEALR
jgi:hypothetical protein